MGEHMVGVPATAETLRVDPENVIRQLAGRISDLEIQLALQREANAVVTAAYNELKQGTEE